MGYRVRRFRRFLAFKLWPECDDMLAEIGVLRTSLESAWARNRDLVKRHGKERARADKAESDLEYLRGCLHTMAAEADGMVSSKCPECEKAEKKKDLLFPEFSEG